MPKEREELDARYNKRQIKTVHGTRGHKRMGSMPPMNESVDTFSVTRNNTAAIDSNTFDMRNQTSSKAFDSKQFDFKNFDK